MERAKSSIHLNGDERRMIVQSLIMRAGTIANPYESDMYKWLAQKLLVMDGSIGLDGQEMIMISISLNKEAESCMDAAAAFQYHMLSRYITQEKVKFHHWAYKELAARYLC